MEIYISDQLTSCLAFEVLGILGGFAYDVIRTLRELVLCGDARSKIGAVLRSLLDFVLDFLYMILLGVSFAVLAYCYSYGKLRSFDLVSFGVAFVLYKLTLGRLYAVSLRPAVIFAKKLTIRLLILATKPVKFILLSLRSFILWVFSLTVGRLIHRIRSASQAARFNEMLALLDTDVRF